MSLSRRSKRSRGGGSINVNQLGDGFFTPLTKRVKAAFTHDSTKAPERFLKTVESLSSVPIQQITFGREAVAKAVQAATNVLSGGDYNKQKEALKYDDVYHNFIVLVIGGRHYKLEKNAVVQITPFSSSGTFHTNYSPQSITLSTLIQKASQQFPNLYQYNPAYNNCQAFVKQVLGANHISPSSEEGVKANNPQNGDLLLSSSHTKKISHGLTRLAAWGDRVIHGGYLKGNFSMHRHRRM